MPSEKPLIYLLLGAAGSGRREVIADLIEGGLAEGEKAAVLISADEALSPADAKFSLIRLWRWIPPPPMEQGHFDREDAPALPVATIELDADGELPADATRIFFLTDGRRSPVDQVEAFKSWAVLQNVELARVICVVNCQLAAAHPRLLPWFDACIHFSDVVLLNHREGVANKWMSDFQEHFKSQFLPCLFEMVKGGRVRNPALLLEPQALRVSHIFDEEVDWLLTNEEGEEVEDEDEVDEDEEITATPIEDIYFARRIGGRRDKEIPDITKFLA